MLFRSIVMHDVDSDAKESDEISKVVAARMMQVDATGNFYPNRSLTSSEAVIGLRRLMALGAPLQNGDFETELVKLEAAKVEELDRSTVGVLLHTILKLPK